MIPSIGILSAFGGKLRSSILKLPDGAIQSGYHLPIYQAFPTNYQLDPNDSNTQVSIATFLHFDKFQKVSLFDLEKQEDGKEIIKQYLDELKSYQYSAYQYGSYNDYTGGTICEVPILEMQGNPVVKQIQNKPLPAEAKQLLKELYVTLIAEAEFDALSEESEKFAKPLAKKIRKLNELLKFENDVEEPKQLVALQVTHPEWGSIPPASGYNFTGFEKEILKTPWKQVVGELEKQLAKAFDLPASKVYKALPGEFTGKIHDIKFTIDPYLKNYQNYQLSDGSFVISPASLIFSEDSSIEKILLEGIDPVKKKTDDK